MDLRPSVAFLAVSALLIVVLGVAPLGLIAYSLLAELKFLIIAAPFWFATLPFAAYFVRPLFVSFGASVHLDEEGFTWSRGSKNVRIDWKNVSRLSHGPFDPYVWIFETTDGERGVLGPPWYSSLLRSEATPAVPVKKIVERCLQNPNSSNMVEMENFSSVERIVRWSSIGLGLIVLLPLGSALLTIPAEFVPLPARIVTEILIAIGTVAAIQAILNGLRAKTIVTEHRLVVRSIGGEKTLPLDQATDIRNSDSIDRHGQPEWSTTVQFPNQTVVLNSRHDGYFEARAILSRVAVR